MTAASLTAKPSRMRALLLAALVLAASPALAQSPRQQVLAALAHVIGESHALRQACEGPRDQYWRERMQRLLETEGAARERLSRAFNAGFLDARDDYPACSPASREVEVRAAARGRALAARLADLAPAPR